MSRPGKRLIKSKSGLKIVAQHAAGQTPWEMSEPPWMNDKEVESCLNCHSKFDFIRRRHHCRRCGRIFCGKCCSSKVQFHRMGFVDPVRHCLDCEEITKTERDFFEKDLKILFDGAPFSIMSSNDFSLTDPLSLPDSFLYTCKLSSDQRYLLFDETIDKGEKIPPIDLCKIIGAEPLLSDEKQDGMVLTIKSLLQEEYQLRLESPPEPSRKPSVLWLSAFLKGMKMVAESQNNEPLEDELDLPSQE